MLRVTVQSGARFNGVVDTFNIDQAELNRWCAMKLVSGTTIDGTRVIRPFATIDRITIKEA